MLLNQLHRLFVWLTPSRAKTTSDHPEPITDAAFEFDPMWHGDHWQNLLSSPMDARRYVMEDWSASSTADWTDLEGAAPAH